MLCLLADAGRASIISMKRMNKHQDKHLFPAAVEVSRSLLLSEKKDLVQLICIYKGAPARALYMEKSMANGVLDARAGHSSSSLSLSHNWAKRGGGGIKKLVEQKILFALL